MGNQQIKISEIFYASGIILIAFVYYWCAQFGLLFAWHHTNVSAVWPPSALGFFVILFFGYRLWPGIWFGAFITNISYFLADPSSSLLQITIFSSTIATGNALEALISCYLVKKLIGSRNPLHNVQDVSRFMLVSMLACSISASIGTITVCLSNASLWKAASLLWLTWGLGDFSGMLTLIPIYWAFQSNTMPKLSLRRALEFLVAITILIIFNGMVFNGNHLMNQAHIHITYLPLALIIGLTYHFGYLGALVSTLVTLFQTISATNAGYGPFIVGDSNTPFVFLQTFITTIGGTSLLLSAALFERQQSQIKIELSEQYFRALVENSMDLIALLNPAGIITYSSPSTEKVLGYKKFEHEGRNIFEFIHPEDEPFAMKEFSRVLSKSGLIVNAILRIKHKNGSWRWIEGSGQNLLSDPAIGAVVINYRDITERKGMERLIQINEERLRQIIDLVPHFIFAKDIEGRFILVNQAVADAYGTTVEGLVGKRDADFSKSQAEVDHFRKDDLEVIQLGDAKIIPEERITTAKGQEIILSTTKIPFRASGVELPCVLGVSVDITEIKKAQELLKDQLKHATRLADIGTLAAIVAHELRTPFGVIQMAVHNLRNKNKEFIENKHLENIEKKVWEGNHIIDNLLSYSRLKIPAIEPCSILNLLDECIATITAQFPRLELKVNKDYKINRNFLIDVDSNQIREVLGNVLSNALQAMQAYKGVLQIIVSVSKPQYLQIEIRDNGVGIDTVDIEKIFQPFFTTKAKGTGLGLAICNEIINLHQGRIDIQSIKGQGTSVFIILPIKKK